MLAERPLGSLASIGKLVAALRGCGWAIVLSLSRNSAASSCADLSSFGSTAPCIAVLGVAWGCVLLAFLGQSTSTRVRTKAAMLKRLIAPLAQANAHRTRPRLPVGSKKIGFGAIAAPLSRNQRSTQRDPLTDGLKR